jgi:hypothetical protein
MPRKNRGQVEHLMIIDYACVVERWNIKFDAYFWREERSTRYFWREGRWNINSTHFFAMWNVECGPWLAIAAVAECWWAASSRDTRPQRVNPIESYPSQ